MVEEKIISRRETKQKKEILTFLKSVHSHPTAEIVYNAVVKIIPSITLATVYRNLNILAKEGIIKRLEINKEFHYDGFTHDHHHAVCEKCGIIQDIYEKNLTKKTMNALENQNTFNPVSVEIFFKGVCSKC
jgi:Fur family transcriptional regulator, peroxide stress response regulator